MANFVGGANIISFNNTNFTLGTGVEVSGTYAKILSSKKPVLVETYSIGGVKQFAEYMAVEEGTGVLTLTNTRLKVTVSNKDIVTITIKDEEGE